MHVLGRALPAELRMPCPARPFAVAGRAAPALPDPGQRLLGAGEAGQGQGPSPWSYYSLTDVRPFFIAGLWSEVLAPPPARSAPPTRCSSPTPARSCACTTACR